MSGRVLPPPPVGAGLGKAARTSAVRWLAHGSRWSCPVMRNLLQSKGPTAVWPGLAVRG